jgi:hypothetical protein
MELDGDGVAGALPPMQEGGGADRALADAWFSSNSDCAGLGAVLPLVSHCGSVGKRSPGDVLERTRTRAGQTVGCFG